MESHYLGIDIAKRKFDAALLVENKYKHKVFSNTAEGFKQLTDWLQKRAGDNKVHACLEATGNYGEALAEYLFNIGYTISLINPAQIKAFAQSQLTRNKTDKVDATLIANYCKLMQPLAWQPLPKPVRELQALVARLEDLVALENQEKNRLEVSHVKVQTSIENTLAIIQQEAKAIREQIKNHINQYPDLKKQNDLLQSIPGIGQTTSAHVLAYLNDIGRFKNAKKIAAFVGLNPKQYCSGSSIKKGTPLSKIGHARLRKALFMPALVARQYNSAIQIFSQRLQLAGKPKMVIVGAVMRKLIHIIYGVLKSGKPFDADLCTMKA